MIKIISTSPQLLPGNWTGGQHNTIERALRFTWAVHFGAFFFCSLSFTFHTLFFSSRTLGLSDVKFMGSAYGKVERRINGATAHYLNKYFIQFNCANCKFIFGQSPSCQEMTESMHSPQNASYPPILPILDRNWTILGWIVP